MKLTAADCGVFWHRKLTVCQLDSFWMQTQSDVEAEKRPILQFTRLVFRCAPHHAGDACRSVSRFQDASGNLGEMLKGKDLKRKSIRAEAGKAI
jgi:hypothetical protein